IPTPAIPTHKARFLSMAYSPPKSDEMSAFFLGNGGFFRLSRFGGSIRRFQHCDTATRFLGFHFEIGAIQQVIRYVVVICRPTCLLMIHFEPRQVTVVIDSHL